MVQRELENRVALVTGGGSGQGRAIALALAARGADIAFGSFVAGHAGMAAWEETTYPTEDQMAEVASAIEQHGRPRPWPASRPAIERELPGHDRQDLRTGSAGSTYSPMSPESAPRFHLPGHPDDVWEKVIDVNLSGTWRMIRQCLGPMMERNWGRILIISSTAANVGAENFSAYCASKAGLLGLMRCAALEGAPHGVTCNAINPGFVDTGMVEKSFRTLERIKGTDITQARAEAAASSPMNRMIQPDEIAAIAAFLSTDAAGGITMEDITVSAGALW